MEGTEARSGIGLLRRIATVAMKIHSGDRLADVLQAIADVVVEQLGFELAAVNYRQPEGGYRTVAVTGSQECADALMGMLISDELMAEMMADAEEWGSLRFVPHDRIGPSGPHWFRPTFEPVAGPGAWHPDDALFAPMTSPTGEVLGVLSVDLPEDRRIPGTMQRELLEVLAAQAGLAISSAQLNSRLRDEHQQLLAEQARLRSSEEAFRFAFDRSATGMALVGLEGPDAGVFLRVNDALGALLGYPPERVVGSSLLGYVAETDVIEVGSILLDGAARPAVHQADYRIVHRTGREAWLSLTSTVIDGTASQPPFLLLHAEDASARMAREQLLVHAASHDPLTALPNRRLLLDRLEVSLERLRQRGGTTTVMFCDLDAFKTINDVHGHRAGDLVLEVVAARLLAQIRVGDTVGRLGGDEFVVLADDIEPRVVTGLRDRLRDAVAAPLDQPVDAALGVSIGVVVVDRVCAEQHDALGIVQLADEAMYRDKARRQALRMDGAQARNSLIARATIAG